MLVAQWIVRHATDVKVTGSTPVEHKHKATQSSVFIVQWLELCSFAAATWVRIPLEIVSHTAHCIHIAPGHPLSTKRGLLPLRIKNPPIYTKRTPL